MFVNSKLQISADLKNIGALIHIGSTDSLVMICTLLAASDYKKKKKKTSWL